MATTARDDITYWWIHISDKGHLKPVFAVGSHGFLCLVAAGSLLTLNFVARSSFSTENSDMMTESWMYLLIFSLPWLFRLLVNVRCDQFLVNYLFPCLSVHVFQWSAGLLGHRRAFILNSKRDCFCFRSPLTHSCTDTYNLHTVEYAAIHSRPLRCTLAMTHWCSFFNGYLLLLFLSSVSLHQWDLSNDLHHYEK